MHRVSHLLPRKHLKTSHRALLESGVVLLLYGLLTLFLTWPVASTTGNRVPGDDDAWYYLWTFWYTRKSLFCPNDQFTLTYTNYILYPDGLRLIPFQTAFNQLLSVLLQFMFDSYVSFTILWLLPFTLGGYGTYLLVKYLTRNRTASFISGVVSYQDAKGREPKRLRLRGSFLRAGRDE